MRTTNELIDLVNKWAEDKGIHKEANFFAQIMKTYEEIGEVISAIESNNKEELSDGIGDSIVTLINAAWFLGEDKFKTLLVQKNDALDFIKNNYGEDSLRVNISGIIKDLLKEMSYIFSEYINVKNPNFEEIEFSIIRILNTLDILCYNFKLDFTKCLDGAYEVISKRTGKIVNGMFIKDK
jgi:NTP pyrophosphatase (non-canonical NTP hydrolase)